jgi:hypothetical protein
LRPEFVFDGIDQGPSQLNLDDGPSYGGGRRNRGAATQQQAGLAVHSERVKEELRELYGESLRRMDPAQTRRPMSATAGVGAEVCACGFSLPPDARFCPKCGRPTPPKVCVACGNTYASDARFCRKCGRPREESVTTIPAGSSPPSESGLTNALKELRFQDEHGFPMRYVSHHELEPARRRIFASAFPIDAGRAFEIIAEGGGDGKTKRVREFTALWKTGATPKLVEGSCQILFEELTPSECIEYTFPEEPDTWRLVQLSRGALETYRSTKFDSWLKMLQEPTCEAQLRRMLQIGPVTRLFDPHVFPTPQAWKSQYQVTDDRTGRTIDLPHPVSKLRIWDAAQQRYESIDSQLTGAPSEPQKDSWWNMTVGGLCERHGTDYIVSMLGQGGAVLEPPIARLSPIGGQQGRSRPPIATPVHVG